LRRGSLSHDLGPEGGKGNLGCFFGLMIVATLAYGAYKFLPPYVSHYQLKDEMREIATLSAAGVPPRAAGPSGKSTGSLADIQEAVLAKAKELEIPLRKQDVKVSRDVSRVFITVKYTIPVELPGHVYDLNFEFSSHN
jgi:hypothetical protein